MPTWIITAASKVPSSEGKALAGGGQERDPVTQADALGELVAVSTNSGLRSMPVTSAPDIAAIREVPPMPEPTSSRRMPGTRSQPVEGVLGRGRSTGMQLVDREQLRRSQAVGVDPRIGERVQDRPGEVVG